MNISESCFYDIPSPTYDRHLLGIEKHFDYSGALHWFVDNRKMSYYFIGAYLVAIFAGRRWMKSKPPFELRLALFLWNAALALFSIVATVRFLPEMHYMMRTYGFHCTICEPGPKQHREAFAIWAYLFALSKIVELGDTAFIVLRKRPLIFLHWYHHTSVILFVWGSSTYLSTIQQYFIVNNLLVHSLMYSYYAFSVLRFRIPRAVRMVITSVQLLQMVAGIFVAAYAYVAKRRDPECCVFDQAIVIAVSIYVSYFVLFLNYFIKNHLTNKSVTLEENGFGKKML